MNSPPPPRGAAGVLLAFLAALGFVAAVYRFVPGLALLGWDGWPLIAAGRIDGPLGLVRPFGEELMSGRYPYGHFYRPLVHLSFGIDHWLWGLDPAGYHRTDLAWLAAASAFVGLLAARIAPARARLAGVVAGALFALHPVQLELVAAPPRRADLMALSFVLTTLLALPRADRAMSRGRFVLIALAAFCAGASKEPGVLAAPLASAACVLFAAPGSRFARALRASAPAWIGTGIYLLARTAVLGGLGGYAGGEAGSLSSRWGELVDGALGVKPFAPVLRAVLILVFLALFACGARVWRGEARRSIAFFATWVVAVLGITSLAGRAQEWYAILLAAPLAIALGWLAAGAAEGLAKRKSAASKAPVSTAASTPAWGPSCAIAALLVALFGAAWIATSPLARAPRELVAASRAARAMLADIEADLGPAPPPGGIAARVDPWIPILAPREPAGQVGRGARALHLADLYTLEAWCELRWPGRKFAVGPAPGPGVDSLPDAILVLLVPGPAPASVWEGL